MPGADEIWRAGDGDAEVAQRPRARGFFLGQLPDDLPPDAWADEAPDKSPDPFELGAENDQPDVGGLLQAGSQHLDRLTASLDDALGFSGADELDAAPAPPADESNGTTTVVEPPIGERRSRRELRKRRAQIRRSHVGIVAAVVVVVLAGASLYIGSRAATGDQRFAASDVDDARAPVRLDRGHHRAVVRNQAPARNRGCTGFCAVVFSVRRAARRLACRSRARHSRARVRPPSADTGAVGASGQRLPAERATTQSDVPNAPGALSLTPRGVNRAARPRRRQFSR